MEGEESSYISVSFIYAFISKHLRLRSDKTYLTKHICMLFREEIVNNRLLT